MAANGDKTLRRFDFFGAVEIAATVLVVVLSNFFFEVLPLALMRVTVAASVFFVATF